MSDASPSRIGRAVALCLALCASAMIPAAYAQTPDIARAQAMAAPHLDDHPLALFQTAITAFDADARAESTFLFYLGQKRWRRYIAARPDLPPDQDRALLGSLLDVFGRPLNEWAFGDIDWLVGVLQAVAAYDAAHPDPMTPRAVYPEAHAASHSDFAGFIDHVVENADDIRAGRRANGLGNRR